MPGMEILLLWSYICRYRQTMYQHLDCIALRTVRLNDSKSLLSAWTRQLGRVTFVIPAGASREARRRKALCTPLATFDAVCDVRPGREFLSLRDVRPASASLALLGTPQKNIQALFVAEVLDLILRRPQPDAHLSDFLFGSVEALAALTHPVAVANFHLVLLFRLTHFAGIEPQLAGWSEKAVFDLRDARFRPSVPLHRDFLSGRECAVLMALSRADYRAASALPLDHDGRRRTLDRILDYYSLHLVSLSSLKSLGVLRSMAE